MEFLRSIEKNAFSLVLNEEDEDYSIDEDKIIRDIKKVVNITDEYGTGLLITDLFIDCDLFQIGIDEVNDINGEFDYVIVNVNKSLIENRNDIGVDIILNILSTIRVGGLVYIPETTYNYFPNKRKGIEAIIKTLGLRIEVSPYGISDGVIASKERI